MGAYQVHHGRHLGTDLLLNENRSAPLDQRKCMSFTFLFLNIDILKVISKNYCKGR